MPVASCQAVVNAEGMCQVMAAAACLLAFKLEDAQRSLGHVADAFIKAAHALTSQPGFSSELLLFSKMAQETRDTPPSQVRHLCSGVACFSPLLATPITEIRDNSRREVRLNPATHRGMSQRQAPHRMAACVLQGAFCCATPAVQH